VARPVILIISAVAVATVSVTGALAQPAGSTPTQTKTQAEIRVLNLLARGWRANRLPGLVDPKTHLLVTNTQAVCQGKGKSLSGHRYSRFSCVVRPPNYHAPQGLRVLYLVLPRNHAALRFLAYRH